MKRKYIALILMGLGLQLAMTYLVGRSQGFEAGLYNGNSEGFERGRAFEKERLIRDCNLDKYSWCIQQ